MVAQLHQKPFAHAVDPDQFIDSVEATVGPFGHDGRCPDRAYPEELL